MLDLFVGFNHFDKDKQRDFFHKTVLVTDEANHTCFFYLV